MCTLFEPSIFSISLMTYYKPIESRVGLKSTLLTLIYLRGRSNTISGRHFLTNIEENNNIILPVLTCFRKNEKKNE